MPDYKLPRRIIETSGVYANVNDLIDCIERHKNNVGSGTSQLNAAYCLAHNHIIELIKAITEV